MRANSDLKTVKSNRRVDLKTAKFKPDAPATRKTTRMATSISLLAERAEPRETAVKLQHYNPQAMEVFVAGTFNDWQPRRNAMIRDGEGMWSAVIELLPGLYEYRLVIDGVWREDSMAAKFSANPFGGLNSVIEVK